MDLLKGLNDKQREAVTSKDGQLLILAGAGSGKTKTITHRIAYLMREKNVPPYHIMAITFTNKAANEMKERVEKLVGEEAAGLWISTFHASCVRILRRFIDRLGYDNDFTIYDTTDQRSLMTKILKGLDIDTKQFAPRRVLSRISNAKNLGQTPGEFLKENDGFRDQTIGQIYEQYQEALYDANALDFDDLIMKTVTLLKTDEEVRNYYSEKFHYIFVDEYQDTNMQQFELVRMLAKNHGNLCVVGDDDQSIYRFRGADIQNILGFEQQYPKAQAIKLEQNYRSTKNILRAANRIIMNNEGRKDKRLWTDNAEGKKVEILDYTSDRDEAYGIVASIRQKVNMGHFQYSDMAILYRTNAQSRVFEDQLVKDDIPYKIYGGLSFYQRKEIKDVLAYLKVLNNPADTVSLMRIINVPKRGIGAKTLNRIADFAEREDISMYEAMLRIEENPEVNKTFINKVKDFTDMMEELRTEAASGCAMDLLYDHLMDSSGYSVDISLIDDREEKLEREENLQEFRNKATTYEEDHEDGSLSDFLQEIALVSDIDNMTGQEDHVTLMTIHSSKGLEFPCVYLVGVEENLFPSRIAIDGGPLEIEEERRLCYVAITRAEKELIISYATRRIVNGASISSSKSRFLRELDGIDAVESDGNYRPKMTEDMFKYNRKAALNRDDYRVPEMDKVDFKKGDTVRHRKFGKGTVLAIEKREDTIFVKVNFEKSGEKDMAAAFAKLKKC